jgi:TetR/AcrR family transcriptional repressor of nem operon
MVRAVGRPCEFDEGQALDAAMRAFWEGGYEATGLDQLQAATGVGRQSLYNKFGDKRALFLRCLARYHERAIAGLGELFARQRPVTAAFTTLFEGLLTEPDADKRMGCFMVNTAMELARKDVEVGDLVARNQRGLEQTFFDALQSGRGRGELPARAESAGHDLATARFLVGALLAVKVLTKSDPRSPAAVDMVRVTLEALRR